jgi:8-oxo-dGTP pyrophosphatase MutT (NUDIX family)
VSGTGFTLAVAVVHDRLGRVMLLHRTEAPYNHWEFPGGKVHDGEDPAAAAVREVAEELGVAVSPVGRTSDTQFADRGTSNSCVFVHATLDGGEPAIREPDLFDEVDFFDIADLESGSRRLSAMVAEWLVSRRASEGDP